MNWSKILTEIVKRIRSEVKPLISDPIAKKTLGIGAGGDPKKYIDLQAEKVLIEAVKEYNITFTLVSEESGIKNFGSNPLYYITVDPIDGTTNTLRGIPFACTSIAISRIPRLDTIDAAVIVDLFHDVTYLVQKNHGAYRNEKKLTPSPIERLDKATIGVDLNTLKIAELTTKLKKLLMTTKHIRHLGANALELCYVADGTIDAFIDIRGKLRTTDIAAAMLIIKEAGAIISTPENNELKNKLDPKETVSFIATANEELHKTILKIIKQA
jgi:myo-inositol-1(or 4)-monophosphatase